ncbi:flagellar assembly protein T N-terminal domain-containing protein [Moritella marina]|uniref:flagellar assembly protein T N-terminal domain-containing protein n=1 Tax=Moritella marina TaxID=90736 RepID=UPI003703F284
MKKLLRNIYSSLAIATALLFASSTAIAGDPMDDVFSLLDSGGGTRSGINKLDGYYVVAMGTSSRSSEAKGYEEARINALRQLTEMINGVTMSGSTSSSMSHVTVSEGNNNSDFSKESFLEVVNVGFKGQLSAAKMLKKGKYDGDYFVAISIAQSDIKNVNMLQSTSGNLNGSGNTIIISTDAGNQSIADFNNASSSVEAKGLASMTVGEQKAREQALQDAIRNAVQQAQGVMLQGKSGTFNDALTLALSTKTEGYVNEYEILDEDIERGSYYVILMAEVNSGKLLNDVNFYLNVLGNPIFTVSSDNKSKSAWITDELERLGFSINDGKTKATHSFSLKQSQRAVEDHKGSKGIETELTVTLKDNNSGDILLTVINEPIKTRIYVKPMSRAKQVSEHVAYKQMQSKLGIEVIQSLAKNAEKGTVYQIVLKNAKRTDVDIFKHVLNNGTAGSVESWDWDKTGKKMTLNYRFSGPLSEAFDQGLQEIYRTFKTQGKGRRPHMEKKDPRSAYFNMVRS